MLNRRQTLRALGALGLAAPMLTACGGAGSNTPRATADGHDLLLVSADLPQSAGSAEAVDGVVSAMSAFAVDLWGAIGKPDDNLALSPYSIAVALAMTANGARGATAREMLSVLHIDSLATYNAGMAALTQGLAGLAGTVKQGDDTLEIDLSAANQLFGNAGIDWQRAFLTALAKQYGAGMRTVDFTGDLEGSRELINGWTSGQTHDRIPEILPKGSIDGSTQLVLVDAVYFKAPWQAPFDKTQTKPGTFTRGDGSSVSAPMMSTSEGPGYVEGLHYRGARLAYAGDTLAMTVALPSGSEPAALRELLTTGLRGRGQEGLQLSMPRWTYRIPTDLKAPLSGLGMADAFGGGADFSGMTEDVSLEIGCVLHQTYVAVDEAGTEAAAATAVGMADSAIVRGPAPLVLDRPFLYVIHDTRHGTPLFVGRVADPGSA
jgi:serpin B